MHAGFAVAAAAAGLAIVSHGSAMDIGALDVACTWNFDALPAAGTGSVLGGGWAFVETGTNADGLLTAGIGSSNTGDTYAFGAAGAADRALGGLRSGNLVPLFGVELANLAGTAIDRLDIASTGEQWRFGATGRTGPDRLDFQWSLDATSLQSGTWSDLDALDFVAPVTAGTVGALNGNAAANRSVLAGSISGLVFNDGQRLWLRWVDVDADRADNGLGIDDFSITAEARTHRPRHRRLFPTVCRRRLPSSRWRPSPVSGCAGRRLGIEEGWPDGSGRRFCGVAWGLPTEPHPTEKAAHEWAASCDSGFGRVVSGAGTGATRQARGYRGREEPPCWCRRARLSAAAR
jgi:hypothetical protein